MKMTRKKFEAWLDGFTPRQRPCKGGNCPISVASGGEISDDGATIDSPWSARFTLAIDEAIDGREDWSHLTAARIRRVYEATK